MKRSTAKALINGTCAAILIGIGCAIGAACDHDTLTYEEPETEIITVQSGDTISQLCAEYCPDNMHLDQYASRVRTLNGLHDDTIHPGDKIEMLIFEK